MALIHARVQLGLRSRCVALRRQGCGKAVPMT
jgi:hypothetical protein